MKKITRRSFLAAAGVSAAALALTACGGSSNSAASTSTAASSTAASAAGDATAAANDPKVTLVYAEVNPLDTIVGQTATHFKDNSKDRKSGSAGRLPAFWVLRTTFWTQSWAVLPPSI